MSDLFKRTVGLGKAYLGSAKEKIDAALTEREDAMRELDGGRGGERGTDADDLLRRAEEKIQSMRRTADARREVPPTASAPANPVAASPSNPPTTEEASAYAILGVAPGADYAAVLSEYNQLAARCDPRRFPEGSEEQRQAQVILERINGALEVLRRKLDPTNHRFGKLELE
ncbi:MAG: hypothetical protein ACKO5K_03460 [Armatimonadota bacterium]